VSKFLAFDSESIAELVSSRDLQTTDFEAARSFVAVLRGQVVASSFYPWLAPASRADILFST